MLLKHFFLFCSPKYEFFFSFVHIFLSFGFRQFIATDHLKLNEMFGVLNEHLHFTVYENHSQLLLQLLALCRWPVCIVVLVEGKWFSVQCSLNCLDIVQ